MLSLRRLTDKTYKKYLELEAEGKLTPRQFSALLSHRSMVRWSEAMDNPKLASLNGVERSAVAFLEATETQE